MKEVINLSTKKITEFTTEDTIYIKDKSDDRGKIYLCQFVSWDSRNWMVEGKLLEPSDNIRLGKDKTLRAKITDCALHGTTADDRYTRYHWFNSTFRALHPLEEHKVTSEGKLHVQKHPAYGGISFHRMNSSNTHLFGSSMPVNSFVALTINRMEHNRDLNSDFFHAREELIEVYLSEAQLAQAITNFNSASTPATIHTYNGDRYPEPPYVSPYHTYQEEFENKMHNISVDGDKLLSQATDILTNKTSISKGDREVILKAIEALTMHYRSNIPYTLEQFSEKMSDVVSEAKQEFTAFKEQAIKELGMDALKQILAEKTKHLTLGNGESGI